MLAWIAAAYAVSPTGGLYGGYYWTPEDNPLGGSGTVVGRLGLQMVPVFDLEIDVGFVQGRTRQLDIIYDLWDPRLNALFHLSPDSRFDVFIAAGAGLQLVDVHRDSLGESSGPDDKPLYKNPSQDFIANAGLGLSLHVAGPFHIRTDFRWLGSFGEDDQLEIDDAFQNWEWTAGIDFRAEAPPDRDGDGIVDKYDDCPDDPEDEDGFQDDDGCPDDDNDEDGIKDDDDSCPDDPEDEDDFQDRDGCPDVDNDKDGIRDKRDRCPDEPEDADGWQDDDGCPDRDNDEDGFVDARDACPNEAETDNNYQDNDGCPDQAPPKELPKEVEKFTGVIAGITFETGKTVIRPSSISTLTEALGVLNKYPKLRILIEGHTDNVGSDAKNLSLSQGRADAVRLWFVSHGIDPGRLEALGFGETVPRADNSSDAGRAENRRVEFKLLQGP